MSNFISDDVLSIISAEAEGNIGSVCLSNLNIHLSGIEVTDADKLTLARCHQGAVQSKKHIIKDEYTFSSYKKLVKKLGVKEKCVAFDELNAASFMAKQPKGMFEKLTVLAGESNSPSLAASDSNFSDINLETNYVSIDEASVAVAVEYALSLETNAVSEADYIAAKAVAKTVTDSYDQGIKALVLAGAFEEGADKDDFSAQWKALWSNVSTASVVATLAVDSSLRKLLFLLIIRNAFKRDDSSVKRMKTSFLYLVAEVLNMGEYFSLVCSADVSDEFKSVQAALLVGRAYMVEEVVAGTIASVVFSLESNSGLALSVNDSIVGHVFVEYSLEFPVGAQVVIRAKGCFNIV
jgi:hypothetical protein